MSNLFPALGLMVLALLGVLIRKTYHSVPVAELKRRANKGNLDAQKLYRAVAYGYSLRALLWLYIGLTSSGAIIVLARILPVWASLLVVGPLLWAAFSLLPARRPSKLSVNLTLLATPTITWLLNYLHPVVSRGAEAVDRRYMSPKHTGIFEREDFIKLLDKQKTQDDSRLSEEELEIMRRALEFNKHTLADVIRPRKTVKTVLAGDTLGAILIDELHKTEQPQIPVKETAKGGFVGVLLLSKLGIKTTGLVSDVMDPTVYYLHEDDTLTEALHAFFTTNYPMFVVVNEFEEYVGIVSIEDIIKQLMGHIPGDDFDQYADIAAVAARHKEKVKDPLATEEPAEPDKPEPAEAVDDEEDLTVVEVD